MFYFELYCRYFISSVKSHCQLTTELSLMPAMLVGALDEDSLKLYTLIWSRSMACQMEPSILEQVGM